MTPIRSCLVLFSLLLLAACAMPNDEPQRNSTFQVPAGGGGGY